MTSPSNHWPEMARDLEPVALRELRAESTPEDCFQFSPWECDPCGIVPFRVHVEDHTGSAADDFRGLVRCQCSMCHANSVQFTYIPRGSCRLSDEAVRCACGADCFVVASCLRFEHVTDGLFFDDGLVVARCSDCGRTRVLVRFD